MIGGSLFHRRNDSSFGTKRVRMSPYKLSTMFLGGFEDALLGSTSCAESCHERAVPAAHDHCVCIRPVEVVLKRGKLKPLSSLAPDLTIHHRAPQRRLC